MVASMILATSPLAFNAGMAVRMQPAAQGVQMKMAGGMLGATAPLGFFDPFGFAKGASPATMNKFREAELKHGRVAMLAAAGMIFADVYHPLFDGKLSSNPLLAISQVPKLGLLQIFVFIGFMEVFGIMNSRRPDYKPGDFLGSTQWETGASWDDFQERELNNGRLAMFGSIGMLMGAYITGKGPLEVIGSGSGGIAF